MFYDIVTEEPKMSVSRRSLARLMKTWIMLRNDLTIELFKDNWMFELYQGTDVNFPAIRWFATYIGEVSSQFYKSNIQSIPELKVFN